MIFVIKASGNHSNRLFQNIHFEAYCYENGIIYSNPSFKNMEQYYVNSCRTIDNFYSRFLNFKLSRYIFSNIYKNIIRFNHEKENDIDFDAIVKKYQNVYVSGWFFRRSILTEKYQDLFIKKYTLKSKYSDENMLVKKLNQLKTKETIIGIHVRRSDYRKWQGGKYYFSDDIYKKYIQSMCDIVENKFGPKFRIILFSDEATSFSPSDKMIISRNSWFIDHHAMSLCDFLIGPPSTFTMWASYMGKTPYFHMVNDSGKIALEDFSLCTG